MPHVQARLLGRRERVADGCHLRVGEHDPRRADAVDLDPRVAARDVVGGQARVVLAHVRQRGAAVHVADRVEPRVVGHLERGIGVDVLAGLETDRVEADVLRRRLAADDHEQLVRLGGVAA